MTGICREYVAINTDDQNRTHPGTCLRACLYVPGIYNELLSKLCSDIRNIENPKVREQSMGFCDMLCQALYNFSGMSLPNYLPPMYYSDDEGDAFFEWIFDNFRFGFLFCQNDDDSGWYLLSKNDDKITRFRSTYKGKETVEYILNYIGMNA